MNIPNNTFLSPFHDVFNINYRNLLLPFIKDVYTSSILIHRHHHRTPWRDDQSINISTCGMFGGG